MSASPSPEIPFIVVMGVCGTGKSTLSSAIARKLFVPCEDADELHPPSNVAKMSQNIPLTDEDRAPWLDIVRRAAEDGIQKQLHSNASHAGIVIACSALRKSYRDVLRNPMTKATEPLSCTLRTYFVYIYGSKEVLLDRMSKRQGHFMKPTMLESQLATLEDPAGEPDVVPVELERSTEEQVAVVLDELRKLGCRLPDE